MLYTRPNVKSVPKIVATTYENTTNAECITPDRSVASWPLGQGEPRPL